jgi:hypothetical protein
LNLLNIEEGFAEFSFIADSIRSLVERDVVVVEA